MNRDIVDGNGKQCNGSMDAAPKDADMTKEQSPPRRAVLRGALAVGCSLWLPVALSGCDSKKGANSAAPPATTKVSQASVQYQTQPKGDQQCSGCQHFIAASNTCELVDGQISPNGWCTLWVKKA